MTIIAVLIHYGGIWHDASYQGGENRGMLIQDDDITYNTFVDRIHDTFGAVDTKYVAYSITCFIQSPVGDGTRVPLEITNDLELRFSLDTNVRCFYVTVSPKLRTIHNSQNHLLNEDIRIEEVPVHSVFGETNENEEPDHVYEENENENDDVSLDSLDEDDPFLLQNSPPHRYIEDELLPEDSLITKQWFIPGACFQDSTRKVQGNIVEPYGRDYLYLGATFDSKDKLIIAVGLYHMKNKVELCVQRSDREYYLVKCKHCDFELRSTSSDTSKIWSVTHFQAPHTCQTGSRTDCARNISSEVIGAYFAPRLHFSGDVLKVKEMAAHLQNEYRFQISYRAALAGRNSAIGMTYGDFNESFQLLPSYMYMVKRCNPGSFVSLKTNDADVFEYAYMALGASINGFVNHCRPVIAVNGTHMKGKNKGFMFVAASMDGNDQIFPLAVGIGDKEDDKSWSWFLSQLRESFGCPHDLLFVSDRHTSITKGVKVVYPEAAHGLCYFHLKENLAKFGEHVVTLFGNAAYCYRKEMLDMYMERIRKASRGAYNQLVEIQPKIWSRSYCPVRRYRFLTSSYAKSVNGVLRWARRLPVCALLECVRTLICKLFSQRRHEAFVRSSVCGLTLAATKRLEVSLREGFDMKVERVNASKFFVKSGGLRFTVDLSTTSCSCREFDLNLIPCPHAAAAIVSSNQSPVSYVSVYYTMKTLCATYSSEVNPTPSSGKWTVPDNVKSRVVLEPNNPNQSRRPRICGIKSTGEPSSRLCSRCKQKGHNRSTCGADISPSSSQESRVQGSRPRRRHRKS